MTKILSVLAAVTLPTHETVHRTQALDKADQEPRALAEMSTAAAGPALDCSLCTHSAG